MSLPPPPPNMNPGTPIWYPPVQLRWLFAFSLIFAGALADRLPATIRSMLTSPLGFFLTLIVALVSYKWEFVPGSFAIFFFLLLVWSAQRSKQMEGYLNASNTVDWVTNSQRWFVEKTLKERPLGIQEKSVNTFPVQGATSQTSNASGTT